MDIGSAILILAPLLAPLAVAQGVDLIHFGIAKSVLPFLGLMFMVLLLVTFWPALSLDFVN